MSLLSIVIPTYNEYTRISPTLTKVASYLRRREGSFEIIVADDGSSDGTPDLINRLFAKDNSVRVIRNDVNHGKGYVIRQGMLAAKGDILLYMDADLATPIEELEKLLTYIKYGFDVVIGSRDIADDEVQIDKTIHRYLMGKIFNFLVGVIVIGGIRDTQCGFKMFTSRAAKDLFSKQKLDGFSFDVEILYLAKKLGYKIKEVPVNWRDVKETKVRIFHDSTKMVKDLFKIRKFHRGNY